MLDMRILYELEYFIYMNSETLLVIGYLILTVSVIARFVRRRTIPRGAAACAALLHFLLIGSVRIVDNVGFGIGIDGFGFYVYNERELAIGLASALATSVVVYASLRVGRNKNRERRTTRIGFTQGLSKIETELQKIASPRQGGKSDYERPVIPYSESHAGEYMHRDSAWNASTFCCRSCGETLLSRSRFCYKCGTPADSSANIVLNGKSVRRDDA